jgi:hypothetical protein
VDVVFIHGFAGDAFRTWTNQQGILWPVTWLASDLEYQNYRPRILSVEYKNPSIGEAWNSFFKSTTILESLLRAGVGNGRQVVFIVHSMGGLVIKNAFNQLWNAIDSTNNNDNGALQLLQHTKAIFFYGTPLQTVQPTTWWNLFKFGFGTTNSIPEDNLKKLSDQFNEHPAFALIKKYAFLESIGGLSLIVNQSKDQTYIIRGIENVDHSSIVKPSTKTDHSYVWALKYMLEVLQTPSKLRIMY